MMRKFGLVILAVLGVLLLAASGVAAHDNDGNTTDHDDAPTNGSAAEWAVWMEQHMIEHMGADAAERMEEHMPMTYEEMGEHMADHQHGSMMSDMMNGMMGDDMSGMGCH